MKVPFYTFFEITTKEITKSLVGIFIPGILWYNPYNLDQSSSTYNRLKCYDPST